MNFLAVTLRGSFIAGRLSAPRCPGQLSVCPSLGDPSSSWGPPQDVGSAGKTESLSLELYSSCHDTFVAARWPASLVVITSAW